MTVPGPVVQLDDGFLESLGLSSLSVDEKQSLLHCIYEELQLRVGSRLADAMSDARLEEFASIIDRDYDRILSWLDANVPDFLDDPLFQNISVALEGQPQAEIVCSYVSTKWLEVNAPTYHATVKEVFAELTEDLRRDAGRLLGRNG